MFFLFAPMGKVEKTRFEHNYTTFVNPALCVALKSPPKMVVWNRNLKIRFPGCFFVSPRWGKSKKRVLNKIIRPSSTRLYALLEKAHPKWWYETKVAKLDSQGVFFVSPRWGKSKKRVLNKIIRPSSTRLYALLEKAHPKWWYETKVAKLDSQGVFFVSPRWGKSKKRVLNKIIRPSSTRLYALLEKAHPKWWYETKVAKLDSQGVFFVSPRWGKSKKRVLNKIIRPSSTRLYALLVKAHPKWCYETKVAKLDSQGVFFVSPRWGKSKKRVLNKIIRPSSTRLYPLLEKAHPKWWYETKVAKLDSQGVFFVSPRWGKSKKRVLNKIIRPSSTRLYALLEKAHPKWWYETKVAKLDSQGVFFVSPRWGKSKKRVLNKIIRPSSTRLYALLLKSHPKWWYETEILKFDSQGVFSFRPDGESRKNAFWTKLYDLRQPGFMRCLKKPTQNGGMKPKLITWIPRVFFSFRPDGESRKNAFWTKFYDFRQPGFMRCLEKPTQNGGMKPKLQNSIPRVFFRFAAMGKVQKTRFEQNYTTFVNPALCVALKSPPKMVV